MKDPCAKPLPFMTGVPGALLVAPWPVDTGVVRRIPSAVLPADLLASGVGKALASLGWHPSTGYGLVAGDKCVDCQFYGTN